MTKGALRLTKKEMQEAVAEGVHRAFWQMLTNAPPADFYAAIQAGVEKGMAAAGREEQPVPAADHVGLYLCDNHNIHVELFDEDGEPIATFAVPDGFSDAIKEAEQAAKKKQSSNTALQ